MYGSTDRIAEDDELQDSTFESYQIMPSSSRVISSPSKRIVNPVDSYLLSAKVNIPDRNHDRFSFRKLWAFTGPGFLMSIAYLDPGNIESDLRSGSKAAYKLLWVLLSAHIIGFLLQRLSARLGVVSGRHMAEVAYHYYPRKYRLFLWLMIEIAIIGSDMQEVIGTSIAFYLLSKGSIPLYAGVLITTLDTLLFLLLDTYGFRKLEGLFAFLITIMALTFGYEYAIVMPNQIEVLKGMFIPLCQGCDRTIFLQAVGIIGAVIMPHNLYLHSALVKSRKIDRTKDKCVKEANFYYFIESGFALLCSFVVNLFVVAVFAHGFFEKTNYQVRSSCDKQPGIPDPQLFPYNNETAEANIYKGGIFLGCEFGLVAMYVWAIGIWAAGQSSTMTGTYAGQFVMEGFLQINWPRWLRVLFTRLIAIAPTLFVAIRLNGIQDLTGMNDLLNCIQMIQLPFALIPIITFTSSRRIMHEYSNSDAFQIFALAVSVGVIGINFYFFYDYATNNLEISWYMITLLLLPTILYLCFVAYLFCNCIAAMTVLRKFTEGISYFEEPDLFLEAPWHQSQTLEIPTFVS